MELVEKILNGDVTVASKLMKDIEDDDPLAIHELKKLYPHTGKAYIVGVTGAPGVGKSTLIDALIKVFCQGGAKVGVIAIDPSSPFTGGAILGDRIRMKYFSKDQSVFIRSVATRGWSGGLSKHTLSMIHVMDAMGKDIVFVETVGSGQVEIDITKVADTSVVALCPGAGDEIQTMKGGILEAADILVVNKADREGADDLLLKLEIMVERRVYGHDQWKPRVFAVRAVNGTGVPEIRAEILNHKDFLICSGGLRAAREDRARTELYEAMRSRIETYIEEKMTRDAHIDELINDIAERRIDPYSVVSEITSKLMQNMTKQQ
jgi:LAO/AO transport system kinase